MTKAAHPRCDNRTLLQRLVAFDSTSAKSNIGLAEFLCEYLDRPGVRITRHPSPDGSKLNLIIAAGPDRESRRGLVLSGHMDVVPPGEDGWTSDPFDLTTVGDSYVGRGAADMKGFLALATNRLAAVNVRRLHAPLVLLFTYDEEVGTLGARHLVENWAPAAYLPRSAIIGEPTSLTVMRMHKGHLRLQLRISGTAAHSGLPHLGRNAIEAAGTAILALTSLRRQLESERPPHSEDFPEVPFVTLNVARVTGGEAVNVVPEHCAIDLGVRLLPGLASAEVFGRIQNAVRQALGDVPFTLELLGESPPMTVPDDAPIHRLLCAQLRQKGSRSAPFATDGGWLRRLDMDCVLFGPGAMNAAHKPNESVPIRELTRAEEVLESIVHLTCETGPSS